MAWELDTRYWAHGLLWQGTGGQPMYIDYRAALADALLAWCYVLALALLGILFL